jgi:1-acyl-sn-glycerol-3-phosphate acyltransferase
MIRSLFYYFLKLMGWSFKNNIPDDLRSFVFIGAPHTSNFDFIAAMAISRFMKRNARFVIKIEWMRFPFNLFFGPLGAIGVDRSASKGEKNLNYTDLMSELFKNNPELVLMIAPEGTRKPNNHWKTGFYYIAQKANVPIVLGYADYKKKEVGLGKIIYPTDFESDMKTIMSFYADKHGRIEKNFLLDERFLGERLK